MISFAEGLSIGDEDYYFFGLIILQKSAIAQPHNAKKGIANTSVIKPQKTKSSKSVNVITKYKEK